jgi:hypothetical protein
MKSSGVDSIDMGEGGSGGGDLRELYVIRVKMEGCKSFDLNEGGVKNLDFPRSVWYTVD